MHDRTKSAHVLISSQCPNNCIFCAVAEKRKHAQFTTKDDVLNFIERSAYDGVTHLTFSGSGEPTLDENFEEYLRLAGSFHFTSIIVFTNGYKLTDDKVRRWKKLGLTSVLISFHGAGEGHDKNVQRAGSFNEALRALQLYAAHDITIAVNTCLTRHNIEETPELVALISQYPVEKHYLSFPEWNGNTFDNIDKLLTYEDILNKERFLAHKHSHVVFDNIPFCFIKRNTRELPGLSPITLLDGNGEVLFKNDVHNMFPDICVERECPLLPACSGFDKLYIKHYGWGNSKKIIGNFLDHYDFTRLKKKYTGSGYMLRDHDAPKVKKPAPTDHSNLTVIMKPILRCNCACVYCSNTEQSASEPMTVETAEKAFTALFRYTDTHAFQRINLLWHGGEPLLMGKDFFVTLYENILKNRNITSSIQSNLLLLDEEWLDIFKKYAISVNSSLDPVVRSLRLDGYGNEQYLSWLDKYHLLAGRNIRTGIVFTITKEHLGMEERIFTYFKNFLISNKNCSGVRFNPIYASGKAQDNEKYLLTTDELSAFLVKMWSLWQDEGNNLPFVPFIDVHNSHVNSCTFNADCYKHFISIDARGNTGFCSRYLDAQVYTGNILHDALEDIFKHQHYNDMRMRNEYLKRNSCNSCEHYERCHGGCPYLGYMYYKDSKKKTPFCDAYKALFTVINNKN